MVAGELTLGVRHKSGLLRTNLADEVHQVMERIAFDIEFPPRPILQQQSQIKHILRPDVAFIRPGVYRDAVGTGLQAQGGCPGHAGNTQMPRIAHQRHFVDIDRQGGGGFHKDWSSIIMRRVRKEVTPQW